MVTLLSVSCDSVVNQCTSGVVIQGIMGRQVESLVNNIKQINISHQEVDRILKALEEMYSETKANAPAMEWMPVTAVGNLLCHELGCVGAQPITHVEMKYYIQTLLRIRSTPASAFVPIALATTWSAVHHYIW